MDKGKSVWGLCLILLGIAGICFKAFDIELFSMSRLWPIFVLIPGLCFEFGYFSSRRNPGLLVPGGILITLGLLFFFETSTSWFFAGYTWPIYIFAPAVGLFQLYLFGERRSSLLIPVFVLTAVAAVCFISRTLGGIYGFLGGSYIWPALLIIIGLILLVGKSSSNKTE